MSHYDAQQKEEDQRSVENALQHLNSLRETFKDVIVIPAIITIEDVCDIEVRTTKGPQRIGDVCNREEIVHILKSFEDNECADPVLVAQYALDDYRQTRPSTSKES